MTTRSLPDPAHHVLHGPASERPRSEGEAIRVRPVAGKGRGVFAARPIRAGDVFERVPVIVLPAGQVPRIEGTVLENYVYEWTEERWAVALGAGSIYNHSFKPNARYLKLFDEDAIAYIALTDIEPDVEITVNYNGDPQNQTPVWFEPV